MEVDAGTQQKQPAPRKSLDEIAALMAENTMKMRGLRNGGKAPEGAPKVPEKAAKPAGDRNIQDDSDDEEIDAATVETPDEDTNQELKLADEVDEADDADEEDVTQLGDDGDEDDGDFDMEIGDDTMFALDDETEVSFKELKELYQSDKATLELLNTQKEAAKEALITRQKAVEDSEKARTAAMAVFEKFQSLIATPMVSKPPAELKQSDPNRYIAHLEAYEEDQERIKQQNADLHSVFDQHLESIKEEKKQLKQLEMQELFKKVPALVSKDEKVRQTASTDIIKAAEYYGFAPEEVNEATDHRIYQMAYDAQQYRKLMARSKSEGGDSKEDEKTTRVRNQTRTLRPRGTTAKSRLSAQAKRVKVAKAKAKTTGKVDDVADFIAAQKSK